jgi:CSLREA domain-containing protein
MFALPAKARLLATCVPALALVSFALAPIAGPRATAAPPAAGHKFVVTSTFDAPDIDTGDGICAAANSHGCTLRAAIMQANFATDVDTITMPTGTFMLTRAGDEDGAVLGDLDIIHDVTIQGAGPGATIVDGNGAFTGDRVFQILDTAPETTLSGMTIRNGRQLTATFASGGGLYWTGGGGHFHLSNVSVEMNQAHYGGGIYLDFGTSGGDVTFDNVTVRANVATTAAGGGIGAFEYSPFALHLPVVRR